jgi:hypothetical protein
VNNEECKRRPYERSVAPKVHRLALHLALYWALHLVFHLRLSCSGYLIKHAPSFFHTHQTVLSTELNFVPHIHTMARKLHSMVRIPITSHNK